LDLYVGTSGFSYKEWKGSFYPADLPAKDMLAYYSERLPAVEINNTFYRLPQQPLLENWRSQVSATFRFSLKASQRITHFKRLKDAGEDMKYFLEMASVLGDSFGVVLVQLPPNMKKDVDRLLTFLDYVPAQTRAAFEFRHPSWFDDDVLTALRERNRALCVSDTDDLPASHIESTSDWGYLRLRRVEYTQQDLEDWFKRMKAQTWKDAFVFFKHEDEGTGPKLAGRFIEISKGFQ
jgi:uncharacterized protein YecE (DUF72 family)